MYTNTSKDSNVNFNIEINIVLSTEKRKQLGLITNQLN